MLLSWQILKQSPMMKHCQEIFWFWVVRGVEKLPLCKKLLVILCLASWKEYWVSGINLSKKREGEIESCFEAKVDFYYPSYKYKLSKTFSDFENIYRKKDQRKSNFEGSRKSELVKRDNLIVLDDVTGLADKSPSFVKFLTVCHKFGYSILYIFHKPATSSPRWRNIMSQMQIFCVFPLSMDFVINFLAKFVARGSGNGYVSRQQLWFTNIIRALEKQSGFSCFCLDKRPKMSGAARYRSMVENPETQYCYLNVNNSDKLFHTFVSKRTDEKDSINFIIVKQVGETASAQVYEFKRNRDELNSNDEARQL